MARQPRTEPVKPKRPPGTTPEARENQMIALAVDLAEKALKLAPQQPGIMDTLGVLLAEKGEVTRGLDLLRKANGLAPKNASIRLNLAKVLVKAGKKDEARKELEELVKLGDKFPAQGEVKDLLEKTK